MAYNRQRLKQSLKRSELLDLNIYKDSLGYPTIGYGHLVTDKNQISPITLAQAEYFLDCDVDNAIGIAKRVFSNFDKLSDLRQEVLIDMSFNLGEAGIRKFKKFISAIAISDFTQAGKEMEDSLWAKQVKSRYVRLRKQLEENIYV